jgi:protein tyrosine phosphatase (PTP) superfamily phosphohydrolase (DUF442 family)
MSTQEGTLEAIYNFEAITDWLGTSGQPTESQFLDIAAAGYSAVINLALPSSDNALPHEGSIVTGHGMAYFHIPVRFEDPTIEDLQLFFGVMKALEGRRVWVHCVVNARVSAFVYLYLHHVRGLSEDAASTGLLRKWRPGMDDVWRKFLSLPEDLILSSHRP